MINRAKTPDALRERATFLKNKNGITLVALIITIIVLLILAVVTISAVNEGSLFAHANNAATKYQKEAENENTMISNMISTIDQYDKTQSHTSIVTWADLGITNVTLNTQYKADGGTEPNVIEDYYVIVFKEDAVNGATFEQYENGVLTRSITNGLLQGIEEGPTITFTTNRMELNFNGDTHVWGCNGNTVEYSYSEVSPAEEGTLTYSINN